MIVKGIITEDFVNYKKPSMTIQFPYCDFKCDKENGTQLCQNYALQYDTSIEISTKKIVEIYMDSTITKSIVFQGLEPFYDFETLINLVSEFRKVTEDDIVIYTGYKENELHEYIPMLKQYKNIVIKYGRYIPNQEPHYDEILGVNLVSDNQYAEKVS